MERQFDANKTLDGVEWRYASSQVPPCVILEHLPLPFPAFHRLIESQDSFPK